MATDISEDMEVSENETIETTSPMEDVSPEVPVEAAQETYSEM